MRLRPFNHRGGIVSDPIIKWILYIAILIAVGFSIKNIIFKFAG
tara:strand:- start:6376 stop:6507 length:132 start_codon:yes stop_codon:yes gene_type:complete